MRRKILKVAVLAMLLVVATAALASADGAVVDGDIATAGNQNAVSKVSAPGATVEATAGIAVNYNGSKHLQPETAIRFVLDSTTLPAGYTVGDATGSLPAAALWNSNDDAFVVTSAISFSAPATSGIYSYTVKYKSHTYTCEAGTSPAGGCLGQNVGGEFTINLEVTDSCENDYTVTFLRPVDGSTAGNDVVNTFKNGRVLPIKVTVFDNCAEEYVTSGDITTKVGDADFVASKTSVDAVEAYSDAGSSSGQTNAFRWTEDSVYAAQGGGFWIFNLDSSGKGYALTSGQTYTTQVKVGTTLVDEQYALLKPVK